MLVVSENRADAGTVSTDSEQATLPASNVQQPHLSRKWYTVNGVNSAYLLFDLGSSLACSVLAVLGANFTSSATLRLRASDSDPTAVAGEILDTGVISAGVKDGYGDIYYFFSEKTARYWRIDLEDLTLPDNIQVGRVVLGPRWTPAMGVEFGWAPLIDDPSRVTESYGGQSHPEILPKKRGIQFSLTYLSDDEAFDNAHALARACGLTVDVLVVPLETGDRVSEQSVWGLLTSMQPIFHRVPQTWTQKFEIKERL